MDGLTPKRRKDTPERDPAVDRGDQECGEEGEVGIDLDEDEPLLLNVDHVGWSGKEIENVGRTGDTPRTPKA